jgi:hypothetical protein
MSLDRGKLKQEAVACLGQDKPAGELAACVARHFPELDTNRENDDLVIKGGQRFLIVRRSGPTMFRVSDNVAAPSTNLVDSGGGDDRTLDQLIDEIASLAT